MTRSSADKKLGRLNQRRSTIRTLIAAVLSATLLLLIHTPALQLNNSIRVTKVATVQAETTRKPSTLAKSEQEKAPTEQQTESKPETVAATQEIVPAPQPQGCEAYRSLINQYNWDVNIAMAIMQAESNCDPNQLSATQDRGLMQVNAVHADMVNGNLDALYDPATNISVAYRVYLSQGWAGWSTYNNGRYLMFL